MMIRALLAFVILLSIGSTAFAQLSQQARFWQQEGWLTDFSQTSVNFSEILSGGPPKDGIPPIDSPKFLPVSKISDLADREPVIGLEINGDARAYPLRVMTWHEIVNDKVGGKPVAVTYCPLCNAAIVFDATLGGETMSFGTSGKLRNSDLIMYDRKTESWWQQFSGEAIVGTLKGAKLKLVPARLESWKDFRQRFPKGKVLVPNNPDFRDYGRNPYADYDVSASPFLYNGSMPQGISPMARVVVVRRDGQSSMVVSLKYIRENGPLSLKGTQISWKKGQASALHTRRIDQGRDVGSVIVKDAASGADMPYDVTFAFVAHAFHPNISIKK